MERLEGRNRNTKKRILAFLLAGAMILQQSYAVFAEDAAGSVQGTESFQPAKEPDGSVLQVQTASDQNTGSENGAEAESGKETTQPVQEQAESVSETVEGSTLNTEDTGASAGTTPESNNALDANASSEQGSTVDAAQQGISDNKISGNQGKEGGAPDTDSSDDLIVVDSQTSGNVAPPVDADSSNGIITSNDAHNTDTSSQPDRIIDSGFVLSAAGEQDDIMVFDDKRCFTYGGLRYGDRIDDIGGIVCYGYDPDGDYPSDITIPASFSVKYADNDNVWKNQPVFIAEQAFANDTHVINVTIEGDVKLPSDVYGVFDSCSNLKKVTFNGKQIELDTYSFWGCSSLEEVWAGNATELIIGQEALKYCGSLKKFTAHSEAETTISQNAFAEAGISAAQITYLVVPETNEYDDGVYTYKLYKEDLTAKITGLSATYSGDYNLTIPNEVTTGEGDAAKTYTINAIADYAFSHDEKGWDIRNVTLNSASGISIGIQAFIRCSNMTGDLKGVTAVGENAFWGTKLNSIELNISKIEDIGDRAFGDQGTNATVIVNAGNLEVKHGHLSRTQGITDLTINADSMSFGWWVLQGDYYGASNLKNITINCTSEINTLPFQVFGDHHNSGFKSITINSKVSNVADQAFFNLGDGSTPVNVEFKNGVGSFSEDAFKDFHGGKGSVIRIHNNMADTSFTEGSSFPKDPNLSIVFDDVTLSYEQIHDDALTYEEEGDNLIVTGLYKDDDGNTQSTFTVPKTLTWKGKTYNVVAIKEGAFKGASGLNVTVDSDIDVRGVYNNDSNCNGAFSNTNKINITFNGANTTLGSAAFMKSSGAVVVSNGTGTFDIGRKAFFDAKNLNLTVYGGSIPVGTTQGSDGWTGNSFQYATGELTLLGTVTGVNDLYAVQISKLTTLAKNADKLSGFGDGWQDIDVVLKADDDDYISWNQWNRIKSLTIDYDSKVSAISSIGSLNNNGKPVVFNFNKGVGTIQEGAFSGISGDGATTINIKGNSATVEEDAFADDENLTVNFDMYYEQVTGTEYNDALTKTTVNYKPRDYRKEGEQQKLLSVLIKDMGLTKEDGSAIDLSEVTNVQFQNHTVTSARVAGSILYNVTGETPVNVGKQDYLLTSDTAFTDQESICITLSDGTRIRKNWTSQPDQYNIDGNESLSLNKILSDLGEDESIFKALGKNPNYGEYFFYWGIYDTALNPITGNYGLYGPGQDTSITDLAKIPYPGEGRLYLYQYGSNEDGWVTFNSGFQYIRLIQNKKPPMPMTDGVFLYRVQNDKAEIVSFVDSYSGDGSEIVPAFVKLPDNDSEVPDATITYPVTAIRPMAFYNDSRLKELIFADADGAEPLRLDSTALYFAPELTKLSGDRTVELSYDAGASIESNAKLKEAALHVTGNIRGLGDNKALEAVELFIESEDKLTLQSNTLRLDTVKSLTIHADEVELKSSCFLGMDQLETLVIDSKKPTGIGAFALKDHTALTEVSFPGGISRIESEAFAGDSALIAVNLGEVDASGNYDNNGKDLTIEKDAFKGCSSLADNKVTCRQIVESAAGTATIPGVPAGVPLGAFLVKTDIEPVEEIRTFADAWYKEQGKAYPVEDMVYFDLKLMTPAGKEVTGTAVDVLLSNHQDNQIGIAADITAVDQNSAALFHKVSGSEVYHVDAAIESWAGSDIRNLTFHVNSLSPFGLSVLGKRYHDDEFWYELSDSKPNTATIVGVYEEGDEPVTELHFTGVTHDSNAFKVVGIAQNALNAVAAEGKTEAAITANKAIKSIVFTNEGIRNTLSGSASIGYNLPENLFEGCTGLQTAVFGNSEEDMLDGRIRFNRNSFKGATALKTLKVYTDSAYVHSMGFNGASGLETIVFTGSGTNAIENSAFVDAKELKYLRIDSMKNAGVSDNAFMASAGMAFVTKEDAINDIGKKIGSFDTYLLVGDSINGYGNILRSNTPCTLYIDVPKAEKASLYENWISSAGKNLKDVYLNGDRTDFGEAADAIDEIAAKKGVTVHYKTNEVDRPFYLDGVDGSDETGDGTYDKPFKTFAALKTAWDNVDPDASAEPEEDTVIAPVVNAAYEAAGIDSVCGTFTDLIYRVQEAYIKNTVTTAGETWESSDAQHPVVLNRDPAFKGVMVQNNNGLSLKNVVLDGGSEAGVEAAAPIITSRANLEIHDGAVIRNNKRTSYAYPDGAGGIYASGGVTMDGGEISGNTGMYGGGIQICGQGSVLTMSGGRIENNTADSKKSYGGGVNVSSGATMLLSGGEILNNKAIGSSSAVGGQGGGIALGADVSGMCQGARLVMYGGTIDGNESAQSGGGLFIQTNCTANITEGRITGNTAHGGAYGGGGIYANGVRDDTQDGRLYLNNVLITDNSADETGGGYAGCCTSTAYIYMGNGAAIYGNEAGDNSDVHIGTEYHVTSWGMQSGTPFAYVSQYMFNGTAYNWKDVENGKDLTEDVLARISMEMSMRSYPDGTQPTTAKVIITGNHSDTKAGGIGSDGFVSIGDAPEPMDVKWTPEATKTILGRDMKEGEKYTFTVYEEKTSMGLNFWWTRYEDIKVGTGWITGGKDGEPAAITFTEIDLGQKTADDIGSLHNYLIVEDTNSLAEDVFCPRKYYMVQVIIGSTLDADGKAILTPEIRGIEIGNILENGDYEFSRGEDIFTKPVSNATNTENIGRIREKADAVTFTNYATHADIQASKIWKYMNTERVPAGAQVIFELYADDIPTGRIITLDGTAESLDSDQNGAADKDGEISEWVAQWTNVPIYRTDSNGDRYKIHEYDDDYARIEYMVKETAHTPASYTSDKEESGLTQTTQTAIFYQPSTIYWKWVTYELYADGEPTGKKITLDLTKSRSKFPEQWVAQWYNLPVYHLDERGKLYKNDPSDKDYSRIVYTVKQIAQEEAHHYSDSDHPPFDPEVAQEPDVLVPVIVLSRTVDFINEYHAQGEYELKGIKTIENRAFQNGDEWSFLVTAADGTPMPRSTEVTIHPVSGQSAAVDFGKIAFSEDDIGKTYTYTVRETAGTVKHVAYDNSIFTVTVHVSDHGDGSLDITDTILKDGEPAESIAFKNIYQIGSLSVKKTVVSHMAADKTKDFHFTVTLQPAAEFSGTHTFGDMTFTDGIAKFTLKDGETRTASRIPAGTHYTVQEDDDAGFIKAPSGGVSGTILHGETAEAAFTNTRRNGSLSISKRVVTLFPEKLNQSFTFTVTLEDKTVQGVHGDMTFTDGVATVTLKHNETKTASNLPAGIGYKIEEAAADLFEVRSDNAEGVIDQSTKTAHFVNTDTEAPFRVIKVDGATRNALPGADLAVLDAQHNIVAEWTTTDQVYTVRGLKIGETYILRERSAPHGYAIAEDTTFTVDKNGKVSGTVTLDDSGAAVVEDPRTESGTGSITVTKYTLKHDNAFKVVNRTFYTALFSDSELKHRVSDVKALVLPNTYTAEVTFDELPYGTYYVGETTEAGDAASTNAVVTKIDVEHQRADLSRTSPNASTVIKNTMAEGVLGAYASVNLTVNKKVVDSKGKAKNVKDTFYFALFSDKNFKNRIRGTSIQAISLSNQSEGSTVFANLPYTEQIYVAEVTKSGKLVSKTRNFGYSVKYSGNGITYSRAEGGTITVTNKGGSSVKGASRQSETENGNGDVRGTVRSVRTGDTTPIVPLVITLILAAAAAIYLAFVRKRMKNRSS